MIEKRSSAGDIAQADLFGDGVGARQGDQGDPAGGGEYLNNCDLSNFSNPAPAPGEKKRGEPAPRDPRFTELEKIGLPRVWLRIAERVGFDAWLDIWRMLSNDESVRHDGGARLPKLRCYSAYSRYQRNRYIEALAAQGMPLGAIHRALLENLRESLDVTNIKKIAKRAKVRV